MAEKNSDTSKGADSLSDILEESKTTYNPSDPEKEVESKEESETEPTEEPEKESEPEPELEPKVTLKYKTHEEAENAYRESERKMHEATTTAARERGERERLQAEVEEFKRRLSEPKLTQKAMTSRVAEVLRKIGELDSTGEDYEGQAAEKWSELLWGVVPSIASDIADEKVRTILESREKENQERNYYQSQRDRAIAMAKESGLDMKTNTGKDKDGKNVNSPDYDLFFSVAKESKGETFEEQVNWTIKEANRIKSAIGESFIKTDEKAKERQKLGQPLGKGPDKPTETKEFESPISITSALRESQKRA